MRIPGFEQSNNPPSFNMDSEPPTTVVPSSAATSTSQLEKEKKTSNGLSRTPSNNSKRSQPRQTDNFDGEKTIEVTPIQEVQVLDKLSDDEEYPSGAKLGIIIASLCLSVFLMALVGPLVSSLFSTG